MRRLEFEDASLLKHAYIVASESEEERFSMAGSIAAAAVCRSEKNIPCGRCPACIKAASGSHPDIRVIRAGEDKQAKTSISVNQVRDAVQDAAVLPNESERKAYIFQDGEHMTEQAQNAALKLLEEPPEGVILILCAPKPGVFLQTVRSRCLELNGNESAAGGEGKRLAEQYIAAVAGGDPVEVIRFCESNNKMKIPEALEFVAACTGEFTDMLCGRRDSAGIPHGQQIKLVRLLEKCVRYLDANVNVKQVFGLLEAFSVPRSGNKEV